MRYDYGHEALMEQLKKGGIRPGLTSMEQLLSALGNPQDSLKVVHIAGTNGKGSTLAFLASILTEAGYKVGRYISPAVVCYEERFQVDGKFISPDRLDGYFTRIEEAVALLNDQGREIPTLFEAETAIAFLYFKDEKTDYALVETGMGGLLDATNVVKAPVLTIISSIGYDHMGYLGDSLAAIAGQKAGIIKPGVPVILSENEEEAAQVIKARAKECRSRCIEVRPGEYTVLKEDYQGSSFLWKEQEYRICLPGRHQIANAVTALHAGELLLRGPVPPKGLLKAVWPARLEIIGRDPLVFRDGAHNPQGAAMLRDFLQKHFTNRRILYIIGVLKDKEYEKMLGLTLPLAEMAFVFKPDNERGLDADILADCVRSFGRPARVCDNVLSALAAAKEQADPRDILVVWGSLSFMEDLGQTYENLENT